MFTTQLKIAWRNIIGNKGYSLMNILGLALGMGVAMLIALWVYDEFDYNANFKNYNRLAQIYQSQSFSAERATGPPIPIPLEKVLREKYGEYFEYISMSSWTDESILKYEENSIKVDGNAVQPEASKMFSLEIVAGTLNGLEDVKSIMISASTAKKLFGDKDPIGENIYFGFNDDLKVTGVYKDFSYNSSLNDVDYFITWDYYVSKELWVKNSETEWGNNSFQLFVQIADNAKFETVEEAIKWAKKDNTDYGVINPELHVLPMQDWKLRSNFENGKQVGGRIEYVFLFGSIGIVVLLLACINFMNVATARSEKRAKEVGVKKTLGANRKHLIKQFYYESFIITSVAFILAIIIVYLFLAPFNELSDKQIEFPWTSGIAWGIALVILCFTALLSGSYPALYLSKFNPIQILKGTFVKNKFSGGLRKALVVFQFVLSISLIIITIIINRQMDFVKNQSHGYDMDALIEIYAWYTPFKGKYELIKEKLLKSGAVTAVSASSSPVTDIYSNQSSFVWEGKPDGFIDDFAWVTISHDYINTLKMKVVEGRNFSKDFASDSNGVLINKAALKYMGLKDPVGKLITNNDFEENSLLKIIGVVDNMVMGSPYTPVKQTLFSINKNNEDGMGCYQLRLNPKHSLESNLEQIEKIWNDMAPNFPFDYDFVDQNYAEKFKENERLVGLIGIFTSLAIFISCLGLFGLTSFIAEQRTKEIGIRKSIGASVFKIWQILSKDFLLLVLVASLLSIPLAFMLGTHWLSYFKMRILINHWYFIIGILTAFMLAILTVSYHAVKAATANPIKSLKTE